MLFFVLMMLPVNLDFYVIPVCQHEGGHSSVPPGALVVKCGIVQGRRLGWYRLSLAFSSFF